MGHIRWKDFRKEGTKLKSPTYEEFCNAYKRPIGGDVEP